MIDKELEIWDYQAEIESGEFILAVTTNGSINKQGKAVMGRGVAKQFSDKYPGASTALATIMRQRGRPYTGWVAHQPRFYSFAVKYEWQQQADLWLVNWSTGVLLKMLSMSPELRSSKIILLPRPGCGNGQLDYEQVRPIVERLPDCVWVCTNEAREVTNEQTTRTITEEVPSEDSDRQQEWLLELDRLQES